MLDSFGNQVYGYLQSIPSSVLEIIEVVGLFILGIILFAIFRAGWLHWRREIFKNEIDWMIMEIKIPREIRKSPKAMEQVLASIHSLRNSPSNFGEFYFDGEVTRWYSLEMVSFSGEAHLYIRFYRKQRNLVEAAFFSYYPDIELIETDDYIDRMPETISEMYSQGYDLWGAEMVLVKSPAYPIKMYSEFESTEEEKEFDPVSTFLEVLGKVKKEEIVGIQIIITPMDNGWRKQFEGEIDHLKDSSTKKSTSTTESGEIKEFTRSLMRTPGETKILEAVEDNLSKPAFETTIRFIYLSPKTSFYDSFARRGLSGAFNQYSALHLNSIRQNYPTGTRTGIFYYPFIFPRLRNEYRKQRLLRNYRHRETPPEGFIGRFITSRFLNWNFATRANPMNIEAVATLYHPPSHFVLTAPHIKRLESRRGGPPAGLAIFGDEDNIERFK